MLEAVDESVPWQRVLWLKQNQYPDNYLDESFLQNLQRNVNVRQYTYRGLIMDTLPVTQHLSLIMVFVAVFTWLYTGALSNKSLVGNTVVTSLCGYFWWESLALVKPSRLAVVTSGSILTLLLLMISPVLQTLSKATTSDSIWPLSAALFLLNAILAEYGTGSGTSKDPLHFPSSLSLNAAVSASAVLSSRLDLYLDVFALMLFSIECFALLPLLRRRIESSTVQLWLTTGTVLCALFLLARVSVPTAALYALSVLALQLGVPFWLLSLQSLKNELKGPWDAAVPKLAHATVQF